MWQFSFHVLVFFLGLLSLSECHEDTEPVLVQIVFRHGDRTPVTVYPNDPNKESIWQKYGGLGQLTQKGMQQHYDYGIFSGYLAELTIIFFNWWLLQKAFI